MISLLKTLKDSRLIKNLRTNGFTNGTMMFHRYTENHGRLMEHGMNPHQLHNVANLSIIKLNVRSGLHVAGEKMDTDYEWYEALEDGELKEEALRNKAIMEGTIEDDDESRTRWVEQESNTPYPGEEYAVFKLYGNKIFWKISNVVPTPRNPQYAVSKTYTWSGSWGKFVRGMKRAIHNEPAAVGPSKVVVGPSTAVVRPVVAPNGKLLVLVSDDTKGNIDFPGLESKVMRKCCFVVEIDAWLRGVSGFGIGEVVLSTFDVLQRFGFFLQMGFTLILATLDGLDVGLLGDVIGGDDCDDDE
ncbi:hypothetical protein Tco_0364117 [Tanacetum coccineum]